MKILMASSNTPKCQLLKAWLMFFWYFFLNNHIYITWCWKCVFFLLMRNRQFAYFHSSEFNIGCDSVLTFNRHSGKIFTTKRGRVPVMWAGCPADSYAADHEHTQSWIKFKAPNKHSMFVPYVSSNFFFLISIGSFSSSF